MPNHDITDEKNSYYNNMVNTTSDVLSTVLANVCFKVTEDCVCVCVCVCVWLYIAIIYSGLLYYKACI
jgi:hypothetical protein